MMRLFAAADCLVVRPPLAPAVAAGATVPIVSFPGGIIAGLKIALRCRLDAASEPK